MLVHPSTAVWSERATLASFSDSQGLQRNIHACGARSKLLDRRSRSRPRLHGCERMAVGLAAPRSSTQELHRIDVPSIKEMGCGGSGDRACAPRARDFGRCRTPLATTPRAYPAPCRATHHRAAGSTPSRVGATIAAGTLGALCSGGPQHDSIARLCHRRCGWESKTTCCRSRAHAAFS